MKRNEIINKAIEKAKEAFYKYLREHNYDESYFNLSIDVAVLSNNFMEEIEHYHWDNITKKVKFEHWFSKALKHSIKRDRKILEALANRDLEFDAVGRIVKKRRGEDK